MCTQAGEWMWSFMCAFLSLDKTDILFPPEELSICPEPFVCFCDSNPAVVATSECVYWKHNMFNCKQKHKKKCLGKEMLVTYDICICINIV